MSNKTVAMQLELPEPIVRILDDLARERVDSSEPKVLSLVEWNTTPNGKEFLREMMTNVKYRALSAKELQQEHYRKYREDGPIPLGRPRLREMRAAVISAAIEQYQKIRLVREAA
jgi:hypothetical protein